MVSGVRSCKDANPSMSVEGPTSITSSKPNYIPKASSPNTVTLWP